MGVGRDRGYGVDSRGQPAFRQAPVQYPTPCWTPVGLRAVVTAISLVMLLVSPAALATALSVKVQGLDRKTARTVRNALSITELTPDPNSTVEQIRRAHKRAPEEITQILQTFGFYEPRIEPSLELVDEFWKARYQVDPGPPVTISKVDIQISGAGQDHPPLIKLKDEFPIQIGDRFQHGDYEQAKRDLLRRALRDGFLDAELTTHTVEVDRRARTANIRLHVETGERYYFGAITVEQDEFEPEFIQKFITLREGEPYSSDAILEQQRVLGGSDYFSEIYVQPRRDLVKDYVIPVEIVPVLRKPNKYSFGIGFSTDTGIRGSVGWERRRLNRRGHRVSAGINASGIGGGVGARYRIPIRNPRDDEFNITAAYVLERPENRESRITQLGFARVVQRGDWRETLAIDFQNEDFEVGLDKGTTQVMVPSIDYTRRIPRRQLFVPKGHRISGTVRGAHEDLLSDTTFAQARVFTKWILPVGKRGRFLTRGEAGYSAVDTVLDLPASYRFYAGGDQSVRGYEFSSLGPTDPSGQVIGGKHLIVGSVELEYRIVGKWSVAGFFDAGNAFNTLDDLDIAQGAGIGVRWTSPIGQIRLDFASAISEPDQPWRIHISIGPDL